MEWYVAVLKKYAEFEGRARPKEYWMFFLFNMIIAVVLNVLFTVIATALDSPMLAMLSSLYSLAVLLPSIAVGVRRLHDTDRSGWMMLLGLIPFIGAIILLVFFAQSGTQGDNQYGPDPLAGGA